MTTVLLPRCIDENGKGVIIKDKLDCETTVVNASGMIVKPIDYEGVMYIPCNVGDKIILYYKNKKANRTFKVVDIEKSEHFFICEIVYSDEETVQMELLNITELVKKGEMTTNEAHLKADQILVSFLYKKGFVEIADAYNQVPKYYE
jgi:phosphomannomutase